MGNTQPSLNPPKQSGENLVLLTFLKIFELKLIFLINCLNFYLKDYLKLNSSGKPVKPTGLGFCGNKNISSNLTKTYSSKLQSNPLREAVKKTRYFMTLSQFHFAPTHPT